jgi:hypothetical protein
MINSPPKRRGPGRPFKPGQSGNPGGKIRNLGVRRALMDMRLQAREYGPEALAKLVQLMRGVVTVGRKRVIVPVHTQGWAAAEIIDRGWGCAPQGLEVTGANGGPIEIEGARLANMSSAELLALESASSLKGSSSMQSPSKQPILSELTDAQVLALNYDWSFWGRPDQQMPAGDWFVWMIMTGRGWGKTRTATENISRMIRGPSPLIAPPGAGACELRRRHRLRHAPVQRRGPERLFERGPSRLSASLPRCSDQHADVAERVQGTPFLGRGS